MYQQPNHSYNSADSLRRLSSNNPFRQATTRGVPLGGLTHSSNSAFDSWVEKNKRLIEESSDEDLENINPHEEVAHRFQGSSPLTEAFPMPKMPAQPVRAGSDSSVNYNRRMSSNNPFAAHLGDSSPVRREHHPSLRSHSRGEPPARPPKPEVAAPPTYEEAAGRERARGEYAQEKSSSSSSSLSHRRHMSPPVAPSQSSRPHRSHSDAARSSRHRLNRDRERERGHESSHRDRDRHHRSSRNKSPKKSEPVKAKNLDTIDKLDVTAFFGGNFHHDGPFDACTPHRNQNSKKAPVMAFPVDGVNSSLKGNHGNIDKDQQMQLAFGNYEEGSYKLYSGTTPAVIKTNRTDEDPQSTLYTLKQNPSVTNFDSTGKAQPIHGSLTEGLGSSTFVDGAPAPRNGHDEYLSVNGGGLGRKKSLVQRLRKNSSSEANSRRNSNDTSTPSEGRRGSLGGFDNDGNENSGSSLIRRVKSLKVGRR